MKTLDQITIEDFKELLNQKIPIQFTPSITLDAELIEVNLVKNYSPLERSPFSFVLRTSQKTDYYPQGSYIIKHPTLGDMYLFLVPIGLDSEGTKYQAIFS